MADTVEPAWQDVEQEAADELAGAERHDAQPVGAVAAIVLVAEGDVLLVEGNEPPVRYGNAVGIARKICQYCFRSSERRLGINHPALLSDWRQMAQESSPVGKLRIGTEESQLARFMQRHQPRYK